MFGNYVLTVDSAVTGTSLTALNKFLLSVSSGVCQIMSFLPSSSEMAISYVLNEGLKTFDLPKYRQYPNCGY